MWTDKKEAYVRVVGPFAPGAKSSSLQTLQGPLMLCVYREVIDANTLSSVTTIEFSCFGEECIPAYGLRCSHG